MLGPREIGFIVLCLHRKGGTSKILHPSQVLCCFLTLLYNPKRDLSLNVYRHLNALQTTLRTKPFFHSLYIPSWVGLTNRNTHEGFPAFIYYSHDKASRFKLAWFSSRLQNIPPPQILMINMFILNLTMGYPFAHYAYQPLPGSQTRPAATSPAQGDQHHWQF